MSLLYEALGNPDVSLKKIKSILKKQPKLIQDYTVYEQAFETGVSLLIVQFLVDKWPKTVHPNGMLAMRHLDGTFLHTAVLHGATLEIVKFLVKNGHKHFNAEILLVHYLCTWLVNAMHTPTF